MEIIDIILVIIAILFLLFHVKISKAINNN